MNDPKNPELELISPSYQAPGKDGKPTPEKPRIKLPAKLSKPGNKKGKNNA